MARSRWMPGTTIPVACSAVCGPTSDYRLIATDTNLIDVPNLACASAGDGDPLD